MSSEIEMLQELLTEVKANRDMWEREAKALRALCAEAAHSLEVLRQQVVLGGQIEDLNYRLSKASRP